MIITHNNLNVIFPILYVVTFLFKYIVTITYSYRRQLEMHIVMLYMLTNSVLFIIGSRLFSAPLSVWGDVLLGNNSAAVQVRSAVGGLVFSVIGIVLLYKWLGVKREIIDLGAAMFPLLYGIQKIGCFFHGCCFGTPTDLPWSVRYSQYSAAHVTQWERGLLQSPNSYSIPIHPVQLYEALLYIGIAFIVWKLKDYWKKTLSNLFFSLSLLFAVRFGLQFFREPIGALYSTTVVWGLQPLHWFIGSLSIIGFTTLFLIEKISFNNSLNRPPYVLSPISQVILLFIISALIFQLRQLFSVFELIALGSVYVATCCYVVFALFSHVKTGRRYYIMGICLGASVVLMSQGNHQYYQKTLTGYHQIDAGASAGGLNHTDVEVCGATYYKHRYTTGGVGYSWNYNDRKIKYKTGINVSRGVLRSTYSSEGFGTHENDLPPRSILDIYPYSYFNWKRFGLGIGAHFGDLPTLDEGSDQFYPMLHLRVGNPRIFEFYTGIFEETPSPFPSGIYNVGIGSNLGAPNWHFSVGVQSLPTCPYLQAEGDISKSFGLKMKYILNTEDVAPGVFSLGVSYRMIEKK